MASSQANLVIALTADWPVCLGMRTTGYSGAAPVATIQAAIYKGYAAAALLEARVNTTGER